MHGNGVLSLGKILFLLLLALGAVVVYQVCARAAARRAQRDTPVERTDDMVRCAHCGVHLPRAEAVMERGLVFCTDDHRRLHRH